MKKSLLTTAVIFLLSGKLLSQTVIGKIVDEDNSGLAGVTLNLYINPNVYNTTTLANGNFSFIITEVKDEQLPTGYAISNNFPNPFNPKTRIDITLPNSGVVKIEVFNLLGESVTEAIENIMNAGTNFVDIELNGLPNGIYLLRIRIDDKYTTVKKVMLIYGSQHLAMDIVSNTQLNKNGSNKSSLLDTTIDSLVATSPFIGRKTFTNLPNIADDLLDLGDLVIERYCPEAPTVLYEGKLYKTVKIENQCWLKENLDVGIMINRIQSASNNGVIEKYCYGDSITNCNKYGGLYQWNEAMQYVTIEGTKGICPTGWHIPIGAELVTLQTTVDYNSNALKAIGQGTGSGQGTNTSGFSALLAGSRTTNGTFYNLNSYAFFWSSVPSNMTDSFDSFIMYMFYYDNLLNIYGDKWEKGYSVRCLKD